MAAAEQNLPTRTQTMSTDDDAVPGEDTSEVSNASVLCSTNCCVA